MNIHDMTEQAYKNGYEAGFKKAQSKIELSVMDVESLTRERNALEEMIAEQRAKIKSLEDREKAIAKMHYKRGMKDFAKRLERYLDVGHLREPTEKCFSDIDVVRMIVNLVTEMESE